MSRKKDWDLETLLSIVGFVFELMRVTLHALQKRNGTVENLRRLLKEPELVDQVFDLIVRKTDAVVSTWQTLYEACHQNRKDSNINEKNFPLVDYYTVKPVEEYCLGHDVSTGKQAEAELKRHGFKLVGMKRAFEYIAAHPDSQLDHPVVVLGAQWQYPSGSVLVPYFGRDDGERYLGLCWFGHEFDSNFRFLVSRE